MTKLSPLASVSETRAVLEAHGLSTKYSLGQNFLINDAILQKIVALADLAPDDYVLEVGPGIGTLTIALLPSGSDVLEGGRVHPASAYTCTGPEGTFPRAVGQV